MNKEFYMKLLSLFSGIGAFEKALDREHIVYELVNYCEIDKYASKAYAAVHGVSEDLNLKDVTKVDTSTLKDIDLITYGWPCTDISQAGNQKGFIDENGNITRSGLFFEAFRIIKDLQPKYAICENVKALTSKKFEKEFKLVLDSLSAVGYNNYYQVLNAKDYGIPQNRERIFIISIRKDVDNGAFVFPDKMPLNIRLKDILEDVVDEKFYLSDEQIKRIHTTSYLSGQRRIQDKEWRDTLCARDWKDPKCVRVKQVCNIYNGKHNSQAGRVFDADGLSPTLDTCNGGNRMPKIVERMTKQAYETLQENDCNAGDVINPFNKKVVNNGLCPTLTTRPEGFKTANLIVTDNTNDFRIRKLTPKECWRLMGFDDEDVIKVQSVGMSNSQMYKQAGNSIVVNVLQAIFRNLFGVNND